ncbi:hypothetical protein CFIO01_11929 [Colletotrichum fioriniae PJ7]|uniref:Uncharacterized protein n=1 Tax=Colletotrichum fioriniae PJ7 TaxID=1445577 RepID=A0A010RI91_9PEZI|nr:hypothetical protein CFIO01_11929 [Colletotrichum fioriniae PJ7]
MSHLRKHDLCNLRLASRTYAAFGLHHILKLIASELRECPKKPFEPPSYLHRLAKDCFHEMIESLLKLGAPPDEFDVQGEAALHVAACRGCAIAELIRGGARLDRRGFHGWTALHVTGQNGREEADELLVRAGATLGIVDNDGLKANDTHVGRMSSHLLCQYSRRQQKPLVSSGILTP